MVAATLAITIFFGSIAAKKAMTTSYHHLHLFGFVAANKATIAIVVTFFFGYVAAKKATATCCRRLLFLVLLQQRRRQQLLQRGK
jgi:hypothetical protein